MQFFILLGFIPTGRSDDSGSVNGNLLTQSQSCGKCSHLAESYEKCVLEKSNYMMEIRTLQTRIVSGYEAELTAMKNTVATQRVNGLRFL